LKAGTLPAGLGRGCDTNLSWIDGVMPGEPLWRAAATLAMMTQPWSTPAAAGNTGRQRPRGPGPVLRPGGWKALIESPRSPAHYRRFILRRCPTPARDRSPMKIPNRLRPLLDEGLIEEVLFPLMSGKEAQIFVVRAGGAI